MPRGSEELTNARKDEIVNACEQLYQSVGFKEVTLKEIATITSMTRTSIYNYFQTKEEIFMEILKREYQLWIARLQDIMNENDTLSIEQLSDKLSRSLEERVQLLKILSMNMYDMEANARIENLVEFKKVYGEAVHTVIVCVQKYFPKSSVEDRLTFAYQFFPFIYGIYPYTEVTEKQKKAMKDAGIEYVYQSIYEITYKCLIALLKELAA